MLQESHNGNHEEITHRQDLHKQFCEAYDFPCRCDRPSNAGQNGSCDAAPEDKFADNKAANRTDVLEAS